MEPLAHNPIDEVECWQLLRQAWFGRLALSVAALPTILPVEYSVDGDEIAICLGQYRLDERSVNNAVVGFAADTIDPETRTGWTVQVQGRTRLTQPHGLSTACGQHEPGQIIYLTPVTLSGQVLQLCPFGRGVTEPHGL